MIRNGLSRGPTRTGTKVVEQALGIWVVGRLTPTLATGRMIANILRHELHVPSLFSVLPFTPGTSSDARNRKPKRSPRSEPKLPNDPSEHSEPFVDVHLLI